MSLLSNLFSRPYGCFKSDDNEISLDSLVLLTSHWSVKILNKTLVVTVLFHINLY